ncbi:MAG: helix-turn-helix transcriptional regulator [Verrucomicrobiota bacterium]
MTRAGHLRLETINLLAAEEWKGASPGWCLFRIRQGQGYWIGDPGSREVSDAEVAVLSPWREGSFLASQLGPVTLDYFRFCPESWIGFFTVAERIRFENLAMQPEHAARFFPASHEAAQQFARLCELRPSCNGLLLRCEMLEIVARVFTKELAQREPASTAVLPASKRIKVFMNQLSEADFLKLSLEEMADHCRCTVRHFQRLFSQSFGIGLRKKQGQLRLLKAGQILVETSADVKDVAKESGYQDPTVFTAAFKKQFGVTPEQWRHPEAHPSPNRPPVLETLPAASPIEASLLGIQTSEATQNHSS